MGVYTIVNNLSPIFTLLVAIPFLEERLTVAQSIGIALLILSGVIVAIPQIKSRDLTGRSGILFCLLSTSLLGFAIAYERLMLNRVDFGAYLIYG